MHVSVHYDSSWTQTQNGYAEARWEVSLIFKYPLTLKPHSLALISLATCRRSLSAPHRLFFFSSFFASPSVPFFHFTQKPRTFALQMCAAVSPRLSFVSPPAAVPFLSHLRFGFALYRRSLAPTTPPLPPSLLPHAHSSCFTQRWRQLWSHCFLAVFLGLLLSVFRTRSGTFSSSTRLKTPVSNTLITRSD